jgi:hypothetical protein
MSYPNGMPNRFEERPLLHPNLRLLAELVTGAGLNFKVVSVFNLNKACSIARSLGSSLIYNRRSLTIYLEASTRNYL